jgi:hypothetical protein
MAEREQPGERDDRRTTEEVEGEEKGKRKGSKKIKSEKYVSLLSPLILTCRKPTNFSLIADVPHATSALPHLPLPDIISPQKTHTREEERREDLQREQLAPESREGSEDSLESKEGGKKNLSPDLSRLFTIDQKL